MSETDALLGPGSRWSTTYKVEIAPWIADDGRVMDVTAFFHIIWADREKTRPVGIDFDGLNAQAGVAKAALRELCRELSQRLAKGEIDLNYICDRWIAQRFEPAGPCPQLEGRFVFSILDGAAKLLSQRILGRTI